jgi:hypothetical protein
VGRDLGVQGDLGVNVLRVIYLDQNLVVNACECMRPSKCQGRDEDRALRSEIERCVDEELAIFPYSEVHLREAANVLDLESRLEQVRFWKKVSKGYRFHDAGAVEELQLQAVLEQCPVRFAREMAVHESQLDFQQELPEPNPAAKKKHAEAFRELVRHWATKSTDDLRGKVHKKEVTGMMRLISEDLLTFLTTGDFPLHRIFSKHNALITAVSWHLGDEGSVSRFEDAYEWLGKNALKIPCLLIDFLGTEYIAEQFASDSSFRKKIEKAEVDHDANDIEAAAHWFPYCDYAITDKKMVNFIFPKLYKALDAKRHPFQLSRERPLLFSSSASSRIEFLNFLRSLKPTEIVASAESELQSDLGNTKTLLYILRTPDPLISRETIQHSQGLSAEILPGGGLRIDSSDDKTSWDNIAACFQKLRDYIDEDGKAATVTTSEWRGHRPQTNSAFLPLGTLSLKIDDIRGAIHCDLVAKS